MIVTEIEETRAPGFLKRTPERTATLSAPEGTFVLPVPQGVQIEAHQTLNVQVKWPKGKVKR